MDIRDQRVVLTLDAGGTNFVFGAMQGGDACIEPLSRPSQGHDLAACLGTIRDGFAEARAKVASVAAISFAFPGPSDYPNGIIGDLSNLPAFRGGVPLGPMLEDQFRVPVFINNDGDLFTFGEAIGGLLPEVNRAMAEAGSPKRFRNLLGATFGTGLGGGLFCDGNLYMGDNSAGAEIWATRNKLHRDSFSEEGVSIRAVRQVYAMVAGIALEKAPEPKVIFEIGMGQQEGHVAAAQEAFRRLGEVAGDALANAITLVDGLVVIGGGLAGAAPLFLPALVQEMNAPVRTLAGAPVDRTELTTFNLEDSTAMAAFLKGDVRSIPVPGTERKVAYDALKRTGVGLSRLGTSGATALGAYAFAIRQLDRA
ncbi:MAG: ROK family protein [Holophaga sp.]|nr:ROK family protein [Holophaga sp.]